MRILVECPKGGRKRSSHNPYPYVEDKAGNRGTRLGWLENGDPVVIRLQDLDDFVDTIYRPRKRFWLF